MFGKEKATDELLKTSFGKSIMTLGHIPIVKSYTVKLLTDTLSGIYIYIRTQCTHLCAVAI